MDQAISKRRLSNLLETAVEGSPDYWYGVVEPHAGSLWCQLFIYRSDAAKLAEDLQGRVVIVSARVLENEDGDFIEPEN